MLKTKWTLQTQDVFLAQHKAFSGKLKLKDSGGVLWDLRNVGEYLNCSDLRRLPDFVPDHVEDPSELTDKWLDFSNHKQLK